MRPPFRDDQLNRRFEVRRSLGEGATATVLQAWDHELGMEVALKLGRDDARSTLLREFQIGASLWHPNLPTYVQCIVDEGAPILVMQHIAGQDLSAWTGPLTEQLVRRVLEGVGAALGYLHGLGFVHGDVKPENIRLREDGGVTLLDLGFVTMTSIELPSLGVTPAYAPPEWSFTATPRPWADIFSLGAVAAELLGRLPTVPADLEQLVGRMKDTVPARRPAFAEVVPLAPGPSQVSRPATLTGVDLLVGSRRDVKRWLDTHRPGAVQGVVEPLAGDLSGIEHLLEVLCSGSDPSSWAALARAFPSLSERLGYESTGGSEDPHGDFLQLVRGRPLALLGAERASAWTAVFLADALVRADREGEGLRLTLACRRAEGPFLTALREQLSRTRVVLGELVLRGATPPPPPPPEATEMAMVLAMATVAGSPLRLSWLSRALGSSPTNVLNALVRLREQGWIELSVPSGTPEVELASPEYDGLARGHLPTSTFRDAATRLLAAVPDDQRALRSRLLAGAGQMEAARAEGMLAAREALESGRFAIAADAFAHCDRLRALDPQELPGWIAALERAGLPRETSAALRRLAAASQTEAARELERRAASILLAAGYQDDGIAQVEDLMRQAGVWVSRWVPVQLVQLLWAYNSRDHDLDFAWSTDPPDPDTAFRSALLYDLVTGLAMWFPFRSATAQAKHLRMALASGQPRLLMRALNAHLIQTAGYRYDPDETGRIGTLLREVHARSGTPVDDVLLYGALGGAAWMEARPREHLDHLAMAREALDRAPDASIWVRDSVEIFHLVACVNAGHFDRVRVLVPDLLEDSRARGDRYLEAHVRVHGAFWSALAEDDPVGAQHQLDRGLEPWQSAGKTILALFGWFHRVKLDLYRGDTPAALERFDRESAAWKRSTMMTLEYHQVVQAVLGGLVAARAVEDRLPGARDRAGRALDVLRKRPHRYCELHAGMLEARLKEGPGPSGGLETLGAGAEEAAWARHVEPTWAERLVRRGVREPTAFARALTP